MSIITGFFGDINPSKAKRGQAFKIEDASAFESVEFFTRAAKTDGSSSEMMKNIDFDLYANGTAVCLGKGEGGHPKFIVLPDQNDAKTPALIVSTSFKAAGNPSNYGLQRLDESFTSVRTSHHTVLDAHF